MKFPVLLFDVSWAALAKGWWVWSYWQEMHLWTLNATMQRVVHMAAALFGIMFVQIGRGNFPIDKINGSRCYNFNGKTHLLSMQLIVLLHFVSAPMWDFGFVLMCRTGESLQGPITLPPPTPPPLLPVLSLSSSFLHFFPLFQHEEDTSNKPAAERCWFTWPWSPLCSLQ